MTNNSIKKTPLVSILVPAYNHQKYVKQSIASILNQTYNNIELIVINDGSTDDTGHIIEDIWTENNKNFTFITRANKGLIKTIEEGFSYMHGKYFCLLASDDYWDSHKIEEQVNVMEKDSLLAIVFTDYYDVNEESGVIAEIKEFGNRKIYFHDVLSGKELPPASIMFRSDSIHNNFFTKLGNIVEDLYLWLYVLQQGGYAIIISQTLAYYRTHSNNTRKVVPVEMLKEHYDIIDYFSQNLKDKKMILSKWALRNANPLSRKYKKESLFYLKKCLNRFYNYTFIKTVFKLIFIWK
jgi:glycosyltransferase involved in cell wall biosynthesis